MSGKAPSEMSALQPYRGKPAVRNDRGDRGNVGIIEARSAPRSYPTGRTCANSGHYKALCACVDRTFVNPNSSRRRPEKIRRSASGGNETRKLMADAASTNNGNASDAA